MTIINDKPYTLVEFEQMAALPENADRLLEYIGGEIIEMVSDSYASQIAVFIAAVLTSFIIEKRLGRVTGADGGYMVSGERYIPDVAFVSFNTQPEATRQAYNPTPPDLAVEVLSPSNDLALMRIKIANYLAAGTVVWVANPDKKQIEIYAPGQAVRTLGVHDTLDGGEMLPGFTLVISRIFDPFGEGHFKSPRPEGEEI